jgi:CRISPR-associated protein (TIGR03986 family)
MAVFVNPYTFVPHVDAPVRRAPAGHAAMGAGRFSGVLEVTLTARTPLLIGGYKEEKKPEVGVLPRRKSPEGAVMVPGSGLMGAVRSLHEALTGSCLRIVDAGWVPVHRHPVNTEETEGLVLAMVDRVNAEGRATHVRICGDQVKIPKDLLQSIPADGGGVPQTGDQLRFEPGVHAAGDALRIRRDDQSTGMTPADITRVRPMAKVTEDCWVLLVTDTNARTTKRKDGKPAPVQFAAGRVSPDARRHEIPETAWKSYQETVKGADDLRTAQLPNGEEPTWGSRPAEAEAEYADVHWPPPQGRQGKPGDTIGRRLRARPYLHEGQPVWVRVADNKVTEIRLSQYWRYRGDKTVGERIGDAKPCTDPANLCWSCRMFGSADTEAREETDTVKQHSYRGHVRIDDLIATAPVQEITWRLAPLASPKPSAGQFYLDSSTVSGRDRIAERDTKPAATWGSIADKQRTRTIRGRKFYWRTETQADPDDPAPVRSRHREHQSEAMSGTVELIPVGTVFTGRVTFDNLDAAEYGSLLTALNPRLLGQAGEVGWEKPVTSVGGGKPFGFGSVTIDAKRVQAETAAERYLGEAGQQPETDAGAITAFRDAVPRTVRNTWAALRHTLEFGFIDDAKVWYPPGDGNPGDESYDKSFEFFAHTTGLRLSGDRYRELIVLPDAALPAARQELDSAAGEHGGQNGQGSRREERRER